jgi:hypothetical protein
MNSVLAECSSYTGDYSLPESDPIKVDDLHAERPAAKPATAGHAVSAPANSAGKRKSPTRTAGTECYAKRRRSSAPAPSAPTAAQQAGHGHPTGATDRHQDAHHKAPLLRGNGVLQFGTTTADMLAAQQQLELGDHHVLQETPDANMPEDMGQNAARRNLENNRVSTVHATAAQLGGGSGNAHIRSVPARRQDGVFVPEVEVQQLRERAQIVGRLESEVASLQQTLEERVQHANKAEEQLAAMRQQVSDLKAALEREQACAAEARTLKDEALQRESNCERRLQAAAKQSEEELERLRKEVQMLQQRVYEAESSKGLLQHRSKQLEHELSLAQAARTREMTELQSRCSDLAKEKVCVQFCMLCM